MTGPRLVQADALPAGETAPDFSSLDRAAKLMQFFSAVPTSNPNYGLAASGFQRAHDTFIAEAQKHKDFYTTLAQNKIAEPPPQDLGAMGAGRIGAAEGLGGAGGALMGAEGGAALGALGGPLAPVTSPLGGLIGGVAGYYGGRKAIKTAATSLAPDQASAKAQYDLTVNAHPDIKLAGEFVASLAAGGAIAGAQRVFARQALQKGQATLMAQSIQQGNLKISTMQRALDLTTSRIAEVEQRMSQAQTLAPTEMKAAQLQVDKLQEQIAMLQRTKPTDMAAQQLELVKARVQLTQQELAEETARLAHPERAATRQAAHETIQAKRDIAVAQAAKAKGAQTLQQWIADNSTRPVPPAITP